MRPENDPLTALSSDAIASPADDYHEAKGTYWTQFDVHTRAASEAILSAVATATGNDPVELPPLYPIIDPDALDALFDTPVHGESNQRLTVTFGYADCGVSVKAHGTVVVEPDWTD